MTCAPTCAPGATTTGSSTRSPASSGSARTWPPHARRGRGEKGISKTEQEKRAKDKAFLHHIPEEGVVDFHSLRVTYATNLARAGVSLQEAQKLMRHGDPKLTMNVYTRLGIHDLHAAVDALDAPTRTTGQARRSG